MFRILPKMEKHKFASISLTVRDRANSSKFQPTGYQRNALLAIFKKNFLLPKSGGHFQFKFLPKMEKHKFASIFLTV